MRTIKLIAVICLLFIFSCKKDEDNSVNGSQGNACSGQTSVSYQGQTYNTIQIGSQCFLKENLNYETGNSWCYDNNPSNCNIYGRLYDWETVMNGANSSNLIPSGVQGICPSGWHIPSTQEWKTLIDYLGGHAVAGGKLKEARTTHWNSPNAEATNTSGFTGLPAGYLQDTTNFSKLGRLGYFWSASAFDNDEAFIMWLYLIDGIAYYDYWPKSFGHSVRCLKD